ncbi:serine acetyltransferase [Gemmatimonas aurantiaca]|nr:serine acetyltransferase [Gemmatimonas aurantiaca]
MLTIVEDIKAIYRNDPSAKNVEFLLYAGFHAIIAHRISHALWELGIPFLPRLISQISRLLTGIEIHPGAKIGKGFFCDHGAGVVIGETTIIGDNVTLYQNVTLGGTGRERNKRHPTIEDNVMIGAGSVLLGPIIVGQNAQVGAMSLVVMRDIPAHCSVGGVPAIILRRNGRACREKLPRTVACPIHSQANGEMEYCNGVKHHPKTA